MPEINHTHYTKVKGRGKPHHLTRTLCHCYHVILFYTQAPAPGGMPTPGYGAPGPAPAGLPYNPNPMGFAVSFNKIIIYKRHVTVISVFLLIEQTSISVFQGLSSKKLLFPE